MLPLRPDKRYNLCRALAECANMNLTHCVVEKMREAVSGQPYHRGRQIRSTQKQREYLESRYLADQNPTLKEYIEMARETNMELQRVKTWFQNRRAR
ncbi:hypothetical protein PROFUN_02568 [Planoprotostelium fungivorum]|uniref:Homeobox domain-containing protein n=1 Tax=Planoprotostelium fungivorum TaxID=1890364 RepID=A0A2P6MPB9_9EUKA|nr:hypothetical protein PROFUN_02568 [Planoprotostelium fungivorum]